MSDLYYVTAGASQYTEPEPLDEVLFIIRAAIVRGEWEFFIEPAEIDTTETTKPKGTEAESDAV